MPKPPRALPEAMPMLDRFRRMAAALVVAACGLGAAPAQAASYTYFSSASVAIPDYDGSTECGTSLTRSLTVSNTFAIGDMNVGVQISHAHRDDMAIYVLSPAGTSVTLAYRSGSNATDINARFDDEAASAITLNGHNATNGYPEEEWRPVGSLSDFDGENVNGVWQLRICDVDPTRTGTFRSFRLEVTDGPPPAGGGGGSSTYSEFFTNTAIYSAGSTQFDNWEPFRTGSPSSGIRSVTIGGSRDTTGRTCSDPALAQQIMDNFRNATGAGGNSVVEGSVSCGGFIWNTGNCAVSGVGIEFNAASSAKVCDGGADHYTLRPHIGNANWGGIAGATASAPSQTMTVSYTTTDPLEVTSTADTDTIGTLRYAINHANANTGDDDITFDIAGAGVKTITLASTLPTLTDADISIDGSTQPGASCGASVDGNGVLLDRSLLIEIDGNGVADDGLRITGSGVTIRGLSIGGATRYGVWASSAAGNPTMTCNHIGLRADGVTARTNASRGIEISGANNPVIGDGTYGGRNVVVGVYGAGVGLNINGGDNASVRGNYFGVDLTGANAAQAPVWAVLVNGTTTNAVIGGNTAAQRNLIVGSGLAMVVQGDTDGLTIKGNYLGLAANGTAMLERGTFSVFGVDNITFGGSGVGEGNVVQSTSSTRFVSQTGAILGNTFGVGADGITATAFNYLDVGDQFQPSNNVRVGDGTIAGANTFRNATGAAIRVRLSTSTVAILGNSIAGSGGPGIDLNGDGVTGNDVGDSDSGPNDLLNFPLINSISGDGTTSVDYDITLDVPAHGAGYRVDFFKNTVSETYGEGEIHLGAVEALAPGATTGTLTTHVSVSPGDFISATTTRIVSGVTYDITSEFSLTATAISSASPLVVTSTADTDTLGTLRHAMNHANANPGDDAITFAIPGAANAVHTIALSGSLPILNDDGISIDGTTQGDAACGQLTTGTPHALRIEIDGSGLSVSQMIYINTDNVTLKGFAIGNSIGKSIFTSTNRTGARLECLYAGTRADGITAWPLVTGSLNGSTQVRTEGAVIVNNLFSGNTDDADDTGFLLTDVNGATVTGNIIGLAADGMSPLGNGGNGFYLQNVSNVVIGGTTPETRNVIADNSGDGIIIAGVNSGLAIRGNLIGMARDGTTARGNASRGISVAGTLTASVVDGNIVSSNGTWGIAFGPGTSFATLAVTNNRIGTDATGLLPRGNGIDGLHFHLDAGTSSGLTVENNVIAANTSIGLVLQDVTGATVRGNFIGVGADGTTPMGNNHGVFINDTGGDIIFGGAGAGDGNIVARNLNIGVIGAGTTRSAILGNSIYANGQSGIDLGGNGVTANDAGDADGGANEGLNHPRIDQFIVDGSSAVSYDLTLDVPAHGNGYRIEFFRTATPDATNGEGEVYLGSVDVAGPGVHAGSLTALVPVGVGESISATTTRKTATGFDITSEFSVNATSSTADPARIAAAKSVEVIDDGLIGGDDTVAIPGATLRYTITIRNDGAGAADAGSTVVTDQIPPNGSFKVGDFGGAPGAGPLGVSQGSPSSGLTYSYISLASGTDDLEFSDDSGATWTYAPMDSGDGTDPGITHIRIRPDGPFSANTGMPPSIDLKYEVVLF